MDDGEATTGDLRPRIPGDTSSVAYGLLPAGLFTQDVANCLVPISGLTNVRCWGLRFAGLRAPPSRR